MNEWMDRVPPMSIIIQFWCLCRHLSIFIWHIRAHVADTFISCLFRLLRLNSFSFNFMPYMPIKITIKTIVGAIRNFFPSSSLYWFQEHFSREFHDTFSNEIECQMLHSLPDSPQWYFSLLARYLKAFSWCKLIQY